MKFLSRFVSIVVVFAMLFTFITVSAADYTWDMSIVYDTSDGRGMPFSPPDKYVSQQNPPDFTWPYVSGALEYELKVCTDSGLSSVAYQKSGLTNNYYNFETTFDTGVNYYWSVRYRVSGGYSEWSEARRFRIDPDAVEFPVPDIEILLDRVPAGHPRIYTTPEDLSSFRAIKDSNEIAEGIYNNYMKNALQYASAGNLPAEPAWNQEIWDNRNNRVPEPGEEKSGYEIYLDFQKECKVPADNLLNQMFTAAFAYLLSGDETVGDFAKEALLSAASWDTDGVSSYAFNDQAHRDFALKGAMAYDWIYDTLTESERETVLTMIKTRFDDMSGLMTTVKRMPYDSHGWTTTGYMGVIAYALKGDVPEAEEWLRQILPLYTAVMMPWSDEDGGWSQGTDYWQYSTNSSKEFTTVLTLGGVIDLYQKAWSKNEPLWALYAFGPNSYGSFGDGSNLNKATFYAIDSMSKVAYFNDDETARWIYNQLGDIRKQYSDYVTSQDVLNGEGSLPITMPYSHYFKDIGWAIMTDEIEDPDKIQLSFKSSRFGSFNHSHADQNSFIIQAYGEKLAIKGGYYDYYHSPHDVNVTRATFSHNSVTHDGGYGQQDDDFSAKGSLTQFVNQIELDSVTGEAAPAYKGDIDKFDRSIIYIRPDVFVVVDDLDAAGNTSSTFEWWLNAEHEMEYTNNSAVISEGLARLSAKVQYPENVTATYYDEYVNPTDPTLDCDPYGSYADMNVQTRVSFKTESVPSTKMIVTMSVYKDPDTSKEAETYYDPSGNYVKLTYDEGATVIVSLKDKEELVTADGISFRGTAVSFTDDSIMLTDGTYLEKDGKVLISAESNMTAVLGLSQICISSADDNSVTVDTSGEYIMAEDGSDFTDDKGRAVNSAIGVDASYNGQGIIFDIQAGSYKFITKDGGILSPKQLSAEIDEVQNSADHSAAVYWEEKPYRTYDIKVGDTVYEDRTAPFEFTLSDSVDSVFIREKIGNLSGEWSSPEYVSVYDDERHSNIRYSEGEIDGEAAITAETTGLESFGEFNMMLAKYDESGKLIDVKEGEKIGNEYIASITGGGAAYKTFLFGKDLKPLASQSVYGEDSTDILGIYADGELIDGFEESQDYYVLTFEKNRLIYPFISVELKDNASKADVDYDFVNETATITITSPSGTQREILVEFEEDRDNIHVVEGANADFLFVKDSMITTEESKESWADVGTIKYKQNGVDKTYDVKLYTYFHGNPGGADGNGSRVFVDRHPIDGNRMEVIDVPADLVGYDYFVLKHDNIIYTLGDADPAVRTSDIGFSFELAEAADVIVLTNVEMPSLEAEGFSEGSSQMVGRYINTAGPEDKYYNIDLLGRDPSELADTFYFNSYDYISDWVDVLPLDGYGIGEDLNSRKEIYNQYVANQPSAGEFIVSGDCTNVIVDLIDYNYRYEKSFEAGPVDLDFPELVKRHNTVTIVVKPRSPKPFENFVSLPSKIIGADDYEDYDSLQNSLSFFCEAENFEGEIEEGVNVYDTRDFLSGGLGVSKFDVPGMEMHYKVQIDEEGDYDFVVKYVAWEEGDSTCATRSFSINGTNYIYTTGQTVDWGTVPENWHAMRTNEPIHLKPGTYDLTMGVVSGVWNYDWFGFIKR